ncbi:helix-turn-helix domain-containing protein [Deinococcus misasensis]|uniref:helix-turn-helix domain-containing protein n=1 Tax=Deinococcus misasensis TaxID=392413 RepID=UPI00068CBA41|nr:helix-turn-helix transcriptional regulator [Deinococcus misasensis]
MNALPVGAELRAIRETKRYTLKEVEAMTGISNAYLSQVETGKILKPSPDKLWALAEVYAVPFEALMQQAGYISFDASLNPDKLRQRGFKTLHGAALLHADLTPKEEHDLWLYLTLILRHKETQ